MSRPGYCLRATGSAAGFDTIADGREALRSGAHEYIVGALPFDLRSPAALTAPAFVDHSAGPFDAGEPAAPPRVSEVRAEPEPETHLARLDRALGELRSPETALEKVVIARTLRVDFDESLDPDVLLSRLVAADHAGNGFRVDLSPAGADHAGCTLVGSSPEVLVARKGTVVTCHPLAGSAPRYTDPDADRASADALAASAKDRREHALVIDSLRSALAPLCSSVDAPATPTLTHTPALWHLGTPIRATLRDKDTTALDLAAALHPTPAVCGTPTDSARELITGLEGDRGFYAGTVGWCDSAGDGEWLVTIRCAELSADGRSARAYAGGGIVAESDPAAELAETSTKFRTVLRALGVAEGE
ncbi:isochorismate synthase [Rhodococcus sp. HNM0569]|nr:isochorismate synthase [Rhodococcus sp. HNM0569]NLU84772.1 isochorismate synthase [Rhodococcus sp. HNM0569]